MRRLSTALLFLALSGACVSRETARVEQPTTEGSAVPADSATKRAASAESASKPLPLVSRPEVVRGLYVNRWAALGDRMWQLIDVAKRTEVNALVIDVKDDRGFVLYRSNVPLARAIGADTNRPMSAKRLRALLDTMRAHEIFPIARIVVAKDPLLAQAKTEWAVKRQSDGAPWLVACLCAAWCRTCDEYRPTFAAAAHAHPDMRFAWTRVVAVQPLTLSSPAEAGDPVITDAADLSRMLRSKAVPLASLRGAR